MLRAITLSLGLVICAFPAATQTVDELYDALELPAFVDVLIEEGRASGLDLERDFLGGDAGSGFEEAMARIYDEEAIHAEARALFAAALEGRDVAGIAAFMMSETGLRITESELSARRAMVDEDVAEAARFAGSEEAANDSELYRQMTALADASRAIDRNVESAMNGQLGFLLAFGSTANVPSLRDEGQVLSSVWAQEGEIRADVTEWLYGFMVLAYSPLDPADVDAYVNFIASPPGQDLNNALFFVFGELYQDITVEVGRTIGILSSESTL